MRSAPTLPWRHAWQHCRVGGALADVKAVQKQLGHTSIVLTADTYTSVLMVMHFKIAEAIEESRDALLGMEVPPARIRSARHDDEARTRTRRSRGKKGRKGARTHVTPQPPSKIK